MRGGKGGSCDKESIRVFLFLFDNKAMCGMREQHAQQDDYNFKKRIDYFLGDPEDIYTGIRIEMMPEKKNT